MMEKVKGRFSPISTLLSYEINRNEITISIERLKLDSNDGHFKIAKNLICWAIIIHYEKSDRELKKIKLKYLPHQEGLDSLLRIIFQQAKFFKIDVDVPTFDEVYTLSARWITGINNSIKAPTSEMRNELHRIGVKRVKDFQLHQTVSNNITQIRYKGYKIGHWVKKGGGHFVPDNQKSKSCDVMEESPDSFIEWANWLRERRSKKSCLFDLKAEHYMESCILEMIDNGNFYAGEHKVYKISEKSEVSFQYPALLYGEKSNIKNNSKYIDILGKTKNRKPVFLELKVYNPSGTTSRGQYLFEAIGQVICYCNFYRQLRKQQDSNFKNDLFDLYKLDWERPILAVVVNDIGEDKTATKFREYMHQIEKQFENNISFEFIELDDDAWQRREIKLKTK